MTVAVIGSRNCENFTVEQILAELPEGCTQIISGGAKGIDALAREAALRLDIPLICYSPDYAAYGKAAPIKRNIQIVEKLDLVLAFWDFYSRGTANTIAQCVAQRVPVRVIGIGDNPLP